MIELSRSFECVYVEIGKDRKFAARYTAERLDVVFLDSEGAAMGRHTPAKLYTRGDAAQLAKAMKAALAEHAGSARLPRSRFADDRVGVDPGTWRPEWWFTGKKQKLKDLRGKVVVVRWFTDGCPFCASSMPALQKLHVKYADQGLAMIGFYHPKPQGHRPNDLDLRILLEGWQITFPVAMDTRWKTLNAWWLKKGERAATSVTFVIDKKGLVRFVHAGPELHPEGMKCALEPERCHADYADLEKAIRILLGS